MSQKEDIKNKSQKVNEIARDCNNKLEQIRKKQTKVIGDFNQKVNTSKIEKIKKHIEAI